MKTYGTYLTPFAVDSLWNSYPENPVFGDFTIPTSDYFPAIESKTFSSGVFLAPNINPPLPSITLLPLVGRSGIWDADAEIMRTKMIIPHWPMNVIPATGSDGQADVVDELTGTVHSFFQLGKDIHGQWRCGEYACTRIDGTGWGTPAHYFQGTRAAGVTPMAGLIRSHELNDGDTMYRHALAMSLTFNALSANPNYIFPATSGDSVVATPNTGKIPEGALMMLPPSFDISKIANADVRKIAETLKVYGAYVVDRNYGTPFVIYMEIGAKSLIPYVGWDNNVAAALQNIRGALRQVVSASAYRDANGQAFQPNKNLNLLSLRGQWIQVAGKALGTFDPVRQAIIWPKGAASISQYNSSFNRMFNRLTWAALTVGNQYTLSVKNTGGALLRMTIRDAKGVVIFDSGRLLDGQSRDFVWSPESISIMISGFSGNGETESSISGQVIQS